MSRRFLSIVFAAIWMCILFAAAVCANSPPEAELEGAEGNIGVDLMIMVLLLILPNMLLTMGTEWLVALAFGFERSFRRRILWLNVWSQLLMRLGDLVLRGLYRWSYLPAVILLEICVYGGEYVYCAGQFPEIPRKRLALFVICANTASLLTGLLGLLRDFLVAFL